VTEPSITITGVPASVPIEQVREAIRMLGIDPTDVVEVAFTQDAVYVEVYSDGRPAEPGRWRWLHTANEAATHRLTIPIIDKDPT
jgi:hypothetical protein